MFWKRRSRPEGRPEITATAKLQVHGEGTAPSGLNRMYTAANRADELDHIAVKAREQADIAKIRAYLAAGLTPVETGTALGIAMRTAYAASIDDLPGTVAAAVGGDGQ